MEKTLLDSRFELKFLLGDQWITGLGCLQTEKQGTLNANTSMITLSSLVCTQMSHTVLLCIAVVIQTMNMSRKTKSDPS